MTERIMVVLPSLEVGGTERQVTVLVRGLLAADRGWRDRLTVVTLQPGGALEDELRRDGVQVVSIDPIGRVPVLGLLFGLTRLLRRSRPDVVYSLLTPANIMVAAARPFARRFRLVWGVRSQTGSLGRSRLRQRALALVTRALTRQVAAVIVNATAAEEYVVSLGLAPARVRVVPNGVDVERFRPRPVDRVAVRAELGLTDTDTLVVSLARYVPEKDHGTLFRALAAFVTDHPRTVAMLVGEDPLGRRPELEALAGQLGIAPSVSFAGPRPDPERLLAAADLCVLSSISEGMPNVVLEALACGTPVVSTDAGDARLLLPGDRVVPRGDAAALARAMSAAIASVDGMERRSMLDPRYSIAAMTASTLAVLRDDLTA